MKKLYFLFLLMLLPLLASAQTKRTINVETAGTLPTLISDEEKYTIEELVLTGELNGTDFRLLRDMAGNNYLGQATEGKLKVLDISGAKIVAGGEKYLDTDEIKGDNFRTWGGEGFHFAIEKPDILPDYLFGGCLFETLKLPNTIIEIGYMCLYACQNLTSFTIPESVTTIKRYAFVSCNSLKNYVIPQNVHTIQTPISNPSDIKTISVDPDNTVYDSRNNCNAVIESATNTLIIGSMNTEIPSGVYGIEREANIYAPIVIIPYSVGYIGGNAIWGTTVIVENWSPFYIEENAFRNRKSSTLYVPEGSVELYSAADYWKEFKEIKESPLIINGLSYEFKDNQEAEVKACYKIGDVIIPEYVSDKGINYHVTSIGNQAFSRSEISSITIPSSVSNIGYKAFEYCRNLTSITISDGVISIGRDAFRSCTSLTSVNIPSNVNNIIDNPFSDCTSLTSIVVENGNTTYDSRSNCNAIIKTSSNTLISGCEKTIIPEGVSKIGTSAFYGCIGLTSIIIPSGVTSIGADAFMGCSDLTTVSVPNSVNSIGDMAFYGCKKMTSINIPEGVVKIGWSTFAYCEALTSISIPSSVTIIDNYGLSSCSGLTDVYCYAENVPTTNNDIFTNSNQENAILHVPAGSVQIYKRAQQWNAFKEIVAIDQSDIVTLCNRGKVIASGSSILINAEDWASADESDDNLETGMYVCVYNGDNLTKTAKLDILSNTLSVGGLKWCIGSDTYDMTNVTTLEKPFSIDENGVAFIKFAAAETPNGGSLQAKLTITVGEESKTYMIEAKPFGDFGIPLTFEAIEGTVTVDIKNYYCSLSPTIQYSIDGGPWTDFTLSNNDCYGTGFSNYLPAGKVVSIRSNEWHGGYWDGDHFEIKCDADCYVYGNVMSLCKGENYSIDYEESGYLAGLFRDNTHIRNHPSKNLVLPSTTLVEDCYARMFHGCTGLTRAPELPATNLARLCYAGMFEGCTSLTEAPVLPATKLEKNCYISMFLGCKNLKYVKCLANDNIIKGDDSTIGENYDFFNLSNDDNSTVTSWLKDAGTNVTTTKTFIVNESLTITGDDPTTATVEKWGERSVSGIPTGWTIGNLLTNTASIPISSAKQLAYCSDKDLDFSTMEDLKAYVATGYDKTTGTIWLTRVKDVPANTGFLLMGEPGDYEVPVKESGSNAYYKNMFKGTIDATTIQTTETINNKEYTNYYLSNGEQGVGFYKVTKAEGQSLNANRAYLPIPTEIPAVGTAGGTESIKVSGAGQVPYYSANSLDFTTLDNVKAYTATGYDYKSGTIWLTRVKKVPALTGILIMAPEGSYPIPTASVASIYENMFKGTLTETTIQTTESDDAGVDYINYYLSKGDYGVGFYKVKDEGVTLNPNRCYLPIPNLSAGTRGIDDDPANFSIQESDEVIGLRIFGSTDGTSGIETNNREPLTNNHWYNLQGQRVENPGKGLYINNGKLVIIR